MKGHRGAPGVSQNSGSHDTAIRSRQKSCNLFRERRNFQEVPSRPATRRPFNPLYAVTRPDLSKPVNAPRMPEAEEELPTFSPEKIDGAARGREVAEGENFGGEQVLQAKEEVF